MRARNHGALKNDHKFSYNSRLDTIQAAILRIKLRNYSRQLNRRRQISNLYYKNLSNIQKIKLFNLKKTIFLLPSIRIRTSQRNSFKSFLKK